jgi:hypothetical protein
MKNGVGTREWAITSAGALSNADRRRLIAQAMLVRAAALPKRVRAHIGMDDRAMARVDVTAIEIPDSATARRAVELVQSLSPPWLVNHCMRTWLWGVMLAQAGKIRFDKELFFVASALHDLGLAGSHKCEDGCAACFAVEGARLAEQFTEREGWSTERRHQLSEAISLHLNIRVGLDHGAEAHMLHEGAALDVIGARRGAIEKTSLQSVLDHYPRLGFKKNMAAVMKEQARIRPTSRAAFLANVGFIGMIREAAWHE